jgi:hypothetical protein
LLPKELYLLLYKSLKVPLCQLICGGNCKAASLSNFLPPIHLVVEAQPQHHGFCQPYEIRMTLFLLPLAP